MLLSSIKVNELLIAAVGKSMEDYMDGIDRE